MSDLAKARVFVVDRVEGRGAGAIAVLVDDGDRQVEVPRSVLGEHAVEGAVLLVPVQGTMPDWARAVRDRDEERRRTTEAVEILKRLSAKDPGGDLEL